MSTAPVTALVRSEPLSKEQIDLVWRTVFPQSNEDELRLYLHDCARQNVHPLDKLIHPQIRVDRKGNRRYTAITSIDLMRSRAEDTGHYAGNDDPVFEGEAGKAGFIARVTVWKMVEGQRCGFTASARWAEYKPDEDFMWRKMPHGMLGKCAEALALRKAFPRQLHGLYAKEEMDQADPPVPTYTPPKEASVPKAKAPSRTIPDGTSSSTSAAKTSATTNPETGEVPPPSGPFATADQLATLNAYLTARLPAQDTEEKSRNQRLSWLADQVQRPLESSSELREWEAARMIEWFKRNKGLPEGRD